jgi:hypothetical protein
MALLPRSVPLLAFRLSGVSSDKFSSPSIIPNPVPRSAHRTPISAPWRPVAAPTGPGAASNPGAQFAFTPGKGGRSLTSKSYRGLTPRCEKEYYVKGKRYGTQTSAPSLRPTESPLRERVIEERTLEPGGSTQFGARFNAAAHRPRLEVRIDAPNHVRHQVECKDVLLGRREQPENCYRVFRVRNKSSWPAFLTFVELIED